MRAHREMMQPANQQGYILVIAVILMSLALLGGLLFTSGGAAPAQAGNPLYPPHEQVPGHISGNDVRDGITVVDLTVHGEKVTCIYMLWDGSYAGGPAITCDWNNQR